MQLHTIHYKNTPIFGILGGMGPLASTEFLNSIYQHCVGRLTQEQDYPRVILFSDPTIPDRTSALQNKNLHVIAKILEQKLESLNKLGISHIIIACLTAHLFLSVIKNEAKKKVINLMELLNKTLDQQHYPSLMLSSKGSYELTIIKHPNIIYPELKDAERINQLIYQIKLQKNKKQFLEFIDFSLHLAEKYHVESLVFGCTELHLVHTFIKQQNINFPYIILDPLEISAQALINLHLTYLDKPELNQSTPLALAS